METSTGFKGLLKLIEGSSVYGSDIQSLVLSVTYDTTDTMHVTITDANKQRWEIPQSIVSRPTASKKPPASSMKYKFSYTSNPFTFEVTRLSDGVVIFKNDKPLIFKDQYIELTSSFDANAKTYGIGESTRLNHALQPGHTYTLWAVDLAAANEQENLYGSFPYYLQTINGVSHGAMLLNSNGMDVSLDDTSLTFKAIGGIIDLYIFAGDSPAAVVSQYTSIVGRPQMMPYWSLGFHNCKYGYSSLQQVIDVVANYSAAQIPLETQWMDIDYMQDYRDFTTDAKNFPMDQVASFVNTLHQKGQRFVPMVDPGIMAMSGYDAYEQGVKDDIFVKDIKGNNYLGQVWPGPVNFPDFLNPKSVNYWTQQIQNFHNKINFDGVWIDMNEVSNFCNTDGKGQVCENTAPNGCPAKGASQTDCCLQCYEVDASNSLDSPPYKIHSYYGPIGVKTMAMSAYHHENISVYDAHNLFGLTEQIATNKALTTVIKKRPFIISRSSFPSTGVWSGKWTGDNAATWNDLRSSVISIMDFNMFGIPMVGADICGFLLDTTEELCARWIELGAFYPFSREHNDLHSKPQELYLWPSVSEAAQKALKIRYQLLPYLYTQFSHAYFEGQTVARALWFNYPSDATAHTIEEQFMLGAGILVSPVLYQGSTSVKAYFSSGLWYKFSDLSLDVDASAASVWKEIDTPLTSTNVHIRGGNIIPTQDYALTTEAARKSPFTLIVAFCQDGMAEGKLFWDDGEQVEIKEYLQMSYEASYSAGKGVFTTKPVANTFSSANDYKVNKIIFIGKNIAVPQSAMIGGVQLESSQYVYDNEIKSLSFLNLGISVSHAINLQWN